MEEIFIDINNELDEIVRNYNIHACEENLILSVMTHNYVTLGIYIGQLIEVREMLLSQRDLPQTNKNRISDSKLVEFLNRIEKEKSTIVKHAESIKNFR